MQPSQTAELRGTFAAMKRLGAMALALAMGCVSAPEAERDGGRACRSERDCNGDVTCGPVRLCVEGFCAQDPIFRVCDGGSYPDGSEVVGQCLTYLNCNSVLCGELVPCVNNRCDRTAAPLVITCSDGGFSRD